MSLIIPGQRPENLRLHQKYEITSDVYNICQRVKELDPNLLIVVHPKHPQPYVVMERGPDHVDRFVARFEELDDRVIQRLQHMLAVPLEHRIAEIDRLNNEENDARGRMTDEQKENVFGELRVAAVKDGMMNPVWSKNPAGKLKGIKYSQEN